MIKDTVEKARQEAADLAATLVGAHRDFHVAPMEALTRTVQGGESLLTCCYCWWSLGDSNP